MIIIGSVLLEHWIARRRGVDWVQLAFFKLNALISSVFLAVTLAEIVFPGFRLVK